MRCNEGLVPTERKEKKRQDVHAAELASAFDTNNVDGRSTAHFRGPDVAIESSDSFITDENRRLKMIPILQKSV